VRTSAEQINAQAAALDFEPQAMEKVARLLELLDAIATVPLLSRHLVLKGGTALNLFLLDLPRLSVDIDLNLVGAPSREEMQALRPTVEAALQAAFASQQLDVRRRPDAHAGGKWSLRYRSVFDQGAELEVDLNTLHRVPLWDPAPMASRLPVFSQRPTVLQEVHEIVAGKLAALVSRSAGRDLFDARELLSKLPLDPARLRIAFASRQVKPAPTGAT
jgi:predicted nucleotidyltransferase component of viral defense system